MLKVTYTLEDVKGHTEKQLTVGYLLSWQNGTHTFLKEAIIRLVEGVQIDSISILTNETINGIDINKRWDWILFLAEIVWLEEDKSYDTLGTIDSLGEDYKQPNMKAAEEHVVNEHRSSQALEGTSIPKINLEDSA